MRRNSWQWVGVLLVVIVAGGFAVGYAVKKFRVHTVSTGPNETDVTMDVRGGPAACAAPANAPALGNATATSSPRNAASRQGNAATTSARAATSTQSFEVTSGPAVMPVLPRLDATAATRELQSGLAMAKEKRLLDARPVLTAALLSGRLTAAQEKQALAELMKLSKKTILGSEVVEGDPYAYHGTFAPGDKLRHLERRERLRVPDAFLLRVNGWERDIDARAGRIKLVRGPFHAVVSKGRFTMDLLLHREGLPLVWVARVPCGLGKEGSTPLGAWRVGRDLGGSVGVGGKQQFAAWWPPEGAGLDGPILYGKPGYALGAKGLWIGLAGIDARTKGKLHYGIHSTSEPDSIGKELSLGCIRLADDDIDLVYSMLYETHSTVQVRP